MSKTTTTEFIAEVSTSRLRAQVECHIDRYLRGDIDAAEVARQYNALSLRHGDLLKTLPGYKDRGGVPTAAEAIAASVDEEA